MSDDQEVQRSGDYTPPAVQQAETPASSMLNFVAMALRDPSIEVSKLEALLRMQREIVAEDAKSLFNQSFGRLQPRLPRIKKNGEVEYKNKQGQLEKAFKFARFEDIMTAIAPLLEEEGFSVGFNTAPRPSDGGGLIVTCILRHRGGHSTETSIPVPLDNSGGKNSLQGYGSSLSYGKRYAMTAALNLVTEGEDDDGDRGGARYITEKQAEELRKMCQVAGRVEGTILQRLFAGAVRSFEELEIGNGYLAAKSTLEGILHQQQKRGTE